MGVQVITGGPRSFFGKTVNKARPVGFRVEAICDGQATKWCENLADNEVWVDATILYRNGITNLSPTYGYVGSGSVTIKGSLVDRQNVYDVFGTAGPQIAAFMSDKWSPIGTGTLSSGQYMNADNMHIFDMIQLVFTGPGSLVIMSY
jgi:hypothetical protein